MKDLKSFNGKRLKTARTLKGMSISELAEALDLQRHFYFLKKHSSKK